MVPYLRLQLPSLSFHFSISSQLWIKDFFQVLCISSRLNLCTLRNATWRSGQGCSCAVLFMSNPSFCSLMLRLTDVFAGSQHAENTWQTEAPGLLGQNMANDIGKNLHNFPTGSRISLARRRGEMRMMQGWDHAVMTSQEDAGEAVSFHCRLIIQAQAFYLSRTCPFGGVRSKEQE